MLQVNKRVILNLVPESIKMLLYIGLATVRPYRVGDNSAYWRGRAQCSHQSAVLWNNNDYNELYRIKQKEILRPHIVSLEHGAKVLDIGCGIGVVSEMIANIRNDLFVDAVDFEEMINVARNRIGIDRNINLIACPAEQYLVDVRYELILSSACYSAIRDLDKMYLAIDNGAKMVRPGGTFLMIDPFHRWKYLARARASSEDIEKYLEPRGFSLIEKSGVLFWPYREMLANSNIGRAKLERKFEFGERLLAILGKHRFADYKILAFTKDKS